MKFRWELYCPVHLQHTYSDSIFLVSNDDHHNLGRWRVASPALFVRILLTHLHTNAAKDGPGTSVLRTKDELLLYYENYESRLRGLWPCCQHSSCPNIGPSFLTNNAAGINWAAPVSSIYYWQIEAPKIKEITLGPTSPSQAYWLLVVVVVGTFRFPPWAQFAISLPIHPRKGRGDMSCELMEHAEIITREEPMSYSMSRLQPPHCRSRWQILATADWCPPLEISCSQASVESGVTLGRGRVPSSAWNEGYPKV